MKLTATIVLNPQRVHLTGAGMAMFDPLQPHVGTPPAPALLSIADEQPALTPCA
jgi:hypothetical protein